MYRILFRPHPSVHAASGTAAPIESCWLDSRNGGRGEMRVGVLPPGCSAPTLQTLLYADGSGVSAAETPVILDPNGTTAYRDLS